MAVSDSNTYYPILGGIAGRSRSILPTIWDDCESPPPEFRPWPPIPTPPVRLRPQEPSNLERLRRHDPRATIASHPILVPHP